MASVEFYKNDLQLDYFSESYLKFEKEFYKYSSLDVPLIFLTDDILREMALSQKNYFRLNKENASDKREHYFYFKVTTLEKVHQRIFEYVGHSFTNAF